MKITNPWKKPEIRVIPAIRMTGFGGHPAGSQEEWDAMAANRDNPTAPIVHATPRSIVGGLVAKLTRSLKSSLETRGELEERIAADTETLRQVNASIAAIETALLSVSDDPALTAEERKAAVEFVDVQLAADVMADLEVTDDDR